MDYTVLNNRNGLFKRGPRSFHSFFREVSTSGHTFSSLPSTFFCHSLLRFKLYASRVTFDIFPSDLFCDSSQRYSLIFFENQISGDLLSQVSFTFPFNTVFDISPFTLSIWAGSGFGVLRLCLFLIMFVDLLCHSTRSFSSSLKLEGFLCLFLCA